MTALLDTRLLVLDVVAGHADLDEAAHQVADVLFAAVPRVRVGDDERPEVGLWGRHTLGFGHPRADEGLVLVGGEQGAHDHGRLVWHLTQRIAGEIRTRILGDRALGRGRPAAEVDALDPPPLHRHRLTRRVRAERRDRLLLVEQLPQACVEGCRGVSRHRVVLRNRAPLRRHLARRVEPPDAGKAVSSHERRRPFDLLLQCPVRPLAARHFRSLRQLVAEAPEGLGRS